MSLEPTFEKSLTFSNENMHKRELSEQQTAPKCDNQVRRAGTKATKTT